MRFVQNPSPNTSVGEGICPCFCLTFPHSLPALLLDWNLANPKCLPHCSPLKGTWAKSKGQQCKHVSTVTVWLYSSVLSNLKL